MRRSEKSSLDFPMVTECIVLRSWELNLFVWREPREIDFEEDLFAYRDRSRGPEMWRGKLRGAFYITYRHYASHVIGHEKATVIVGRVNYMA